MPLPFLLMQASNKLKLFFSAFLIGFIFNFHPISGLGGIILYITLCISYYVFYNPNNIKPVKSFFSMMAMIILGMLPFIFTYFTQTESKVDYDIALYEEAFSKRIPSYFEEPFQFLKQWLNVKTLFFIIPIVAYLFLSKKKTNDLKKAKILIISTFILLFLPSLGVYVENAVNTILGFNLRMAFQFIRLQKLAILPAYFALAFMLLRLIKYQKFFPWVFAGFLGILLTSKAPALSPVPLIGDDVLRSILPKSLSLFNDGSRNYEEIDEMMDYIAKNTHKDDVFIGPAIIRSATKRSIKLDYKGASAIIEGNPKQFIKWYIDRTEFENLNEEQQSQFLIKKGVRYILVPVKKEYGVELIHQVEKWHLYKIK